MEERQNRHKYSTAELQWIKDNFDVCDSTKDLCALFNQTFNTNIIRQNFSKKCKELEFARGNCQSYTQEEDDWLRKYANTVPYSQLAELFSLKFSRKVTGRGLNQHCTKIGVFSENPYQFGNKIAWNKADLLTERTEKRGNCVVVKTERGWINKARYIYEQAYGEIPKKHQVVFLDNNNQNFELSNLYCIPTQYMLMMNRNHWFTSDRELTLTAIKLCELHYKINNAQ